MPRRRVSGGKRRAVEDEDDECDDDDETKYVKCIGSSVYFYSDVNKKTVLALMEALAEATKNAADTPTGRVIYLFIHSDGGEAYCGISAMQHIKNHVCKVVTICDAFVASAATLIFLAGHERRVMRHSHMLIHQLSLSFEGRYADMRDEFSNTTLLMDTYKRIYSETTKIPARELKEYMSNERHIDADTCVKYGIAHAVI